MANPKHVEIVKSGADAIRELREKNPGVRFDLRGADLRWANLSRAEFSGAEFSGGDLSEADLQIDKLLRGMKIYYEPKKA